MKMKKTFFFSKDVFKMSINRPVSKYHLNNETNSSQIEIKSQMAIFKLTKRSNADFGWAEIFPR